MNDTSTTILDFGEPAKEKSIIKVIGVGGGGSNAVNHMYREGIHDVNFVVCNTDSKALNDSPVPVHLQLGREGLGAGNRPEKAREAAEESIEEIKALFNDGTKMAFITAGMGGGTGTGAGPIVARVSKEMGVLTVGIVTIPFKFEGDKKIDRALDGVDEMAKHVDALLVINNERLLDVYSGLSLMEGFSKADDTLSVAAKSIAEIITMHGVINLDFNDVKTILKDGGVAIMSTGEAEGEDRVKKAINNALHSPLLNDNDIYHSRKILISINFYNENDPKSGLMIDEMQELKDFLAKFEKDYEYKWGIAVDPELGQRVKVTILATGFGLQDVNSEEMQQHIAAKLTQAEMDKRAEEEERRRELDQRRITYYGQGTNNTHYGRKACIYLFRPEDLDNDDLIQELEDKPTYKRNNTINTEIRSRADGMVEKPKEEPQHAEAKQTTISFAEA